MNNENTNLIAVNADVYSALITKRPKNGCFCCGYISGGFHLLKKNFLFLFCASLIHIALLSPSILFAIVMVSHMQQIEWVIVQALISFSTYALSYFLSAGVMYAVINSARNNGDHLILAPKFVDMFSGVTKFFCTCVSVAVINFAITIVVIGLSFLVQAIAVLGPTAMLISAIVIVLIDVFFLIVMIGISMALPTALEYKGLVTPLQAFRVSWILVFSNFCDVFGFFLLAYLFLFLGIITILGWIFFIPLVYCSYIFAFTEIIGLKEQFEQPEPTNLVQPVMVQTTVFQPNYV